MFYLIALSARETSIGAVATHKNFGASIHGPQNSQISSNDVRERGAGTTNCAEASWETASEFTLNEPCRGPNVWCPPPPAWPANLDEKISNKKDWPRMEGYSLQRAGILRARIYDLPGAFRAAAKARKIASSMRPVSNQEKIWQC